MGQTPSEYLRSLGIPDDPRKTLPAMRCRDSPPTGEFAAVVKLHRMIPRSIDSTAFRERSDSSRSSGRSEGDGFAVAAEPVGGASMELVEVTTGRLSDPILRKGTLAYKVFDQ